MIEARIAFIDFEASSLSTNSWPIEAGWALIDHNQQIHSDSVLIRPDPSWPLEDWAAESAAIHQIDITELHKNGVTPLEAHYRLLGALSSRLIYSDAPRHDRQWLARLTEAAGAAASPLKIMPVGLLFQSNKLDEMLYDRKYRKLIKGRKHRAESDAVGWAQLYLDCFGGLGSCN